MNCYLIFKRVNHQGHLHAAYPPDEAPSLNATKARAIKPTIDQKLSETSLPPFVDISSSLGNSRNFMLNDFN